jgi:hypothetical protein
MACPVVALQPPKRREQLGGEAVSCDCEDLVVAEKAKFPRRKSMDCRRRLIVSDQIRITLLASVKRGKLKKQKGHGHGVVSASPCPQNFPSSP